MPNLLNDVKIALRVSNSFFDDEITDLIEAAKVDLGLVGLKNTDDIDPLVKRAIILFAKANFGMANPDSVKYDEAYHNLRMKLSLSSEHTKDDV